MKIGGGVRNTETGRERGKGKLRLHHLKPKGSGRILMMARQRLASMAAAALVSPRRDPIERRREAGARAKEAACRFKLGRYLWVLGRREKQAKRGVAKSVSAAAESVVATGGSR